MPRPVREWLIAQLQASPGLVATVGDRIYEGKSQGANRTPKSPYIVYTMGNETSEALSEDEPNPQRRYCQVWVHDQPLDYTQIDQLVTLVIEAVTGGAPDAEYGLIRGTYLETSRDLDDEATGTGFKYVRFQLVTSY